MKHYRHYFAFFGQLSLTVGLLQAGLNIRSAILLGVSFTCMLTSLDYIINNR